jgi:hypothetical protein
MIDKYKIIRYKLPIVKLESINLFAIKIAPTSKILKFGILLGALYVWIMVHTKIKRETKNYILIQDDTIIDMDGYLMHYIGSVIFETGVSYHLLEVIHND